MKIQCMKCRYKYKCRSERVNNNNQQDCRLSVVQKSSLYININMFERELHYLSLLVLIRECEIFLQIISLLKI